MEMFNNADPGGFNVIKILVNAGPGTLTLKHASPLSQSINTFWLPSLQDIEVPYLGSVTLVHAGPSWVLIATTTPPVHAAFKDLNVSGPTTLNQLQLPSISPAGLPPGRTDKYNPPGFVKTARIRVSGTVTGSILSGLAGASDGVRNGDVKIVQVFGLPVTLKNMDPGSTSDRQFLLPNSSDLVIPPLGSVTLVYDELQHWFVIAKSF